MKSKFIKGLSLALSASMIMTATPVYANITNNVKQSTDASQTTKEKNYKEGQAIVMFKGASDKETTLFADSLSSDMEIVKTYEFDKSVKADNELSADASLNRSGKNEEDLSVSLVKSNTYSTEELIAKLKARSDVKYAEPNYIVHKLDMMDDAYYGYQWAQDNSGQNGGTAGFDVNYDEEALKSVSDEETVVAIVDTGIDYTHEDLKNIVWCNPYSDVLHGEHGYDFVNNDDDPMDDNGHGSHCAGIINAESSNQVGIAGTARDNNIKVMSLKFLDSDGSGGIFDAIGAYNYIYRAQNIGVNVVAVNNSWGGPGDEYFLNIFSTVMNRVGDNGAISVCAAGNESADNDSVVSIPSGVDSDYVISVAASNEKDELADFSNHGTETVDIAAPGTDILSTVSYTCFNPGIYHNREELCSKFENFEDQELVQTISDNSYEERELSEGQISYGTNNMGYGVVSVSINNDEYFESGDENQTSLKWNITGAKLGDTYTLYLPYVATASETPVYNSSMIKAIGPAGDLDSMDLFGMPSFVMTGDCKIGDNGIPDTENEIQFAMLGVTEGCNYWNHSFGMVLPQLGSNQVRAQSYILYAAADGDYTVYIDNAGISKGNVEEAAFGKYDYYNGTSMAAPHVSAAIAATANVYPYDCALDIRKRVLGCVRKSDDLTGEVCTGGTLDLSKVGNPMMSVLRTNYKDGTLTIEGNYLDGAKVILNDNEITPVSQDSESIVISCEGYENSRTTVTVAKDDDIYSREFFFAKGKQLDNSSTCNGQLNDGNLVSGGDCYYYVDKIGQVSIGVPVKDKKGNNSLSFESLSYMFNPTSFSDEYDTVFNYEMYTKSDVVCINDILYTVVGLNLGYAEEMQILSFDGENGWSSYCELPEQCKNLSGVTLAAYEGSLYLMGGVDVEGNPSASVYKFDRNTYDWTEVESMPEGRFNAKAMQVGKSLVVTLGATNNETIPENYIFNGESWTKSNAQLDDVVDVSHIVINDVNYLLADAQIGLVENGIIYEGMRVCGLGDLFTYNLAKDSFEETGNYVDQEALNKDCVLATTIEDQLYILSGDRPYIPDDEDWEDYKNTEKKANANNNEEDEDDEDEDDSYLANIDVMSMPVKTGYVKVTGKSTTGAEITGAGYYLPGDDINLNVSVDDGYLLESFTVNGKPCTDKVIKGLASDYPNGITAVVTTKPSQPQTPDPTPQTPDPTPQTPDPTPQTTDPAPQTPAPQTPAPEKPSTVKKPGKTKVTKVKRASNGKSMKVTFKKVKGAKGYEVRYSTSKKFTSKTTKRVYVKGTSVTIKKLKASKKYYVQVRAYKVSGKKKVYGSYCSTKTANVIKKK